MDLKKLLIIEDSRELSSLLQRGLAEEGYLVEVAASGAVAFRRLEEYWDLVILDLMLPDVSGEVILEFIHRELDSPRVLVLTARDHIADKVSLFEKGCDDYLTKPFDFNELLGRVRALLRRSTRPRPDNLEYEGLTLDPLTNRVSVGSSEIALTPKEFAILRQLVKQPGQIISRKELLCSVWGLTGEQSTNFFEVHLANLRKKLGRIDREKWLHTVRATGVSLSRPEAHGS